jgi:predicted SAM-dependent methyltransferase
MNLHIGCGSINFGKEWIHIDQDKKKFVQFTNIFNLPFDSQSIDKIYSSYLVQSLTKEETLDFFKECKRVIKKGGTIVLSVPDYFLISDKYIKSKLKIDEANRFLMQDTKQLLDFVSLQKYLMMTGFYGIKRLDIEQTPPPKEDSSCVFYNGENISLTIEAYG